MFRTRQLIAASAFGAVLSLLGGGQVAYANLSTPQTIEQRSQGAARVAIVRVLETRAERMRNQHGDDLIVTRTRLSVRERLKGSMPDQSEMIVEGGTLDGMTLKVSDLPEVKEGDEMVVFLDDSNQGQRPHLRGQGILFLEKGHERVRNSSLTLNDVRQKVRQAQQAK